MLRTRMNLDDCPYYVDAEGNITLDSFVKSQIVHHAFNWSGRLFLFHLGCCNDSQMEYELISRPMMRSNDHDLLFAVEEYVSQRFKGKSISVLTTSEKCSILKRLFYEYKSSVPQLSRVLGLSRNLVRKVLSTWHFLSDALCVSVHRGENDRPPCTDNSILGSLLMVGVHRGAPKWPPCTECMRFLLYLRV